METNKMCEEDRQLTYLEFPSQWVWNKKQTKWNRGKVYKADCEALGFLDAGLWNGTRMMIIHLGRRFIEAQIITGPHVGERSIFH
jgi:hypothetical protein